MATRIKSTAVTALECIMIELSGPAEESPSVHSPAYATVRRLSSAQDETSKALYSYLTDEQRARMALEILAVHVRVLLTNTKAMVDFFNTPNNGIEWSFDGQAVMSEARAVYHICYTWMRKVDISIIK